MLVLKVSAVKTSIIIRLKIHCNRGHKSPDGLLVQFHMLKRLPYPEL
jgi:hypothetical protein